MGWNPLNILTAPVDVTYAALRELSENVGLTEEDGRSFLQTAQDALRTGEGPGSWVRDSTGFGGQDDPWWQKLAIAGLDLSLSPLSLPNPFRTAQVARNTFGTPQSTSVLNRQPTFNFQPDVVDFDQAGEAALDELARLDYEAWLANQRAQRNAAAQLADFEAQLAAEDVDRRLRDITRSAPEMSAATQAALRDIAAMTSIDDVPDQVLAAALSDFGAGDILNDTAGQIAVGGALVGAGPVAGDAAAIESDAATMAELARSQTQTEADSLAARMAALETVAGDAGSAAISEARQGREAQLDNLRRVNALDARLRDEQFRLEAADKSQQTFRDALDRERAKALAAEQLDAADNLQSQFIEIAGMTTEQVADQLASEDFLPLVEVANEAGVVTDDELELIQNMALGLLTGTDSEAAAAEMEQAKMLIAERMLQLGKRIDGRR